MKWIAGLFTLAFVCGAMAQTTIQYDQGDLSDTPFIPNNQGFGNVFTGLDSNIPITAITFWSQDISGYSAIVGAFESAVSGAPEVFQTNLGAGGSGFQTLTGLNINFTGTDIVVAIQSPGRRMARDATAAPNGHALNVGLNYAGDTIGFVIPDTDANFVLRISGPTGLPVELLDFEID
jgi:hypothetical protein